MIIIMTHLKHLLQILYLLDVVYFIVSLPEKVAIDSKDYLSPYQLKRLLEENVLRKADIAKLPCIRHSRRCLVESIKERGWKNQQKLNRILNTILHIHNERKFIDQAVKLMIEDNSELLKGSKNDEDIIARYSKHKKSKKHHARRSSIPFEMDFLNTDESRNDFQTIKLNNEHQEGSSLDEDEEHAMSMFSPEERDFVSSLQQKARKNEMKRSRIDEESVRDAGVGNFQSKQYLDNNEQQQQQQQPYSNFYQYENALNTMPDAGQFYGDDNDRMGGVNNRESIGSPNEGELAQQQEEGDRTNENDYQQNNDNDVSKFSNVQDEIGEQNNSPVQPVEYYKKPTEELLGSKRDGSGVKKDMTYFYPPYLPMVPSAPMMVPPAPLMVPPVRSDAYQQLKHDAFSHMEKMQNINISAPTPPQKKPKKKLTKHQKAKLNHKKREENFKKLYSPINDDAKDTYVSDMNGGLVGSQDEKDLTENMQEEKDLKESIKSLEMGWDLDLEEKETGDEIGKQGLAAEALAPTPVETYQQAPPALATQAMSPSAPVISLTMVRTTTNKAISSTKKKKIHHKAHNNKHSHHKKRKLSKNHSDYSTPPSTIGVPESHQEANALDGNAAHYRYPIENRQAIQIIQPFQKSQLQTPTARMLTAVSNYVTKPSLFDGVPDGAVKPSRVCKPGVMKTFFEGKPNCLIIGDSIALGYSYSAAAALNGSCQVQLAPSSKAGVALDSSYGKQCLDYFLSTISLKPTQYDVILFNFGLHDIDYLDKYPEESHNITQYVDNLKSIKKRLLDTGATVGFVLSTPVTYNKQKDNLVRKYNHAAKRVMERGNDKIMTINLHKIVTRECGPIPFENCYMMKKPHDVHYGVTGSIMLGKRVASAISYLLNKRRFQRSWTALTPSSVDLASNKTLCAIPGTACPANSLCMNNIVSRSGHACCQLQGGVDCGDSWHCCPYGTKCHPGCSDIKCSCIAGTPPVL